ncbi:coilin-like [Gossypium australe]|uniref:Coilin-like n=1 Tax=Gossypium australe TaxID=47621 RepID=A0A5B6W8N1_9ROSI|nr:coilin-like [Gossypium australe]
MLRAYVIDFEKGWEHYLPLAEFVYVNKFQSSMQMASFEALYGRRCRTPVFWYDLFESKIVGLEFIREIEDIVKVSPWKKVLRFSQKGKLNTRFIGPYEITERVGPIAYWLALPEELHKIYDVFHVSMIERYQLDLSHVIPP